MIVGLVTCYREGELVVGAVDSLRRACDLVLVLEGPAPADRELAGAASPLTKLRAMPKVLVQTGQFTDDAEKRTRLVEWAQEIHRRKVNRPGWLWLVWCDADEVLLWPEYLPDYLAYLAATPRAEQNATGGFALRHVEPDGSVHLSWGRVLNGENVKRYLVSGYQVELASGVVVALPLTQLCAAGGIPRWPADFDHRSASQSDLDELLAVHRPPLQGEPHILHRHPLRSRGRAEQRMHDDEAAWFERAVDDASR